MAVRSFNGTSSDDLIFDVGDLVGMTHGTSAMLLKHTVASAYQSLGYIHNESGVFQLAPMSNTNFNSWQWFSGGASSNSPTTYSTDIWYLVVIRKATGSNAPRFSVYNFSTATWAHSSGGAVDDGPTVAAGWTIRHSFQGGSPFFAGKVAARAYWSNALPWSPDSSGDAAVEAAGLEIAATNWVASSPSAFWLYNQDDVTTPVDDLSSAGTAVQTSRSGTTVDTADDPPGFDFSLAGPDEGTLDGTFSSPSADLTGDSVADGSLSGTFGQPAIDLAVTATAEVSVGGTFAAPVTALNGELASAGALAGTFSNPTVSMTGGLPSDSRDILFTIEPGTRAATSIEIAPARTVVEEGTVPRTEIGAGAMDSKWRNGSKQFIDFTVKLLDPEGELTLGEVQAMPFQVAVTTTSETPATDSTSWIDPSVPMVATADGTAFRVAILHMYQATAKGLHYVWVKFGPTPEEPIYQAATFVVL